MRILFIGGTGTISTACLTAAQEAGASVTVLCRGNKNDRLPNGITHIQGDAYNLNLEQEKHIAHTDWDCIVNWTIYDQEQAKQDIKRFSHNTRCYIFISSTSVYDDSNQQNLITESQKYLDTTWYYSQSKIKAEQCFLSAFENDQFPVTIIRPGHTYNDFTVPTNIQGLGNGLINRILQNKKILIHDDGESYWTLTHSLDFAQAFIELINNDNLAGEVIHVTTNEYQTWNDIFNSYSNLLSAKLNKFFLSTSEIYNISSTIGQPIKYDKQYNRIFNISKLKEFAPGFKPSITLHNGIERVIRWHRNNESKLKSNTLIENELSKLGI